MKIEHNKHAGAKNKADEEYILTTKLYCGECKSLMVGESGINHQGKKYRYYKCIDAKRGKGCKKKAVKKDDIEDVVLKVVVATLSNEKYINSLISALMNMQESENYELKELQKELSRVDKKIANLLNAIEQGILTESTKQRLQELEQIKQKIESDIAKEKISKPKYTREQYKEFFDKYKTVDITKQEHRKALVNYFVNAVVLYDGDLVFYMNYKNSAFKLPFSKIKQSSDSILNSLPKKHRFFGAFFLCLRCFTATLLVFPILIKLRRTVFSVRRFFIFALFLFTLCYTVHSFRLLHHQKSINHNSNPFVTPNSISVFRFT